MVHGVRCWHVPEDPPAVTFQGVVVVDCYLLNTLRVAEDGNCELVLMGDGHREQQSKILDGLPSEAGSTVAFSAHVGLRLLRDLRAGEELLLRTDDPWSESEVSAAEDSEEEVLPVSYRGRRRH